MQLSATAFLYQVRILEKNSVGNKFIFGLVETLLSLFITLPCRIKHQFFLKNCGFFSDRVTFDQFFTREATGKQPEINFDDIEHDDDVFWDEYGERRETLLEKSERIYEFLTEYVRQRPEKEIAIVCHSAYLFTLLNAVMDITDEELRSWFLTSEVRSLQMTFVDRD